MKRLFAALAFALLAGAMPAAAQQDYPNHTISMVVPFPPGGVADITARPLAEAMTRILKQSVIVENKPGAGGGLGMQYVARARPDGYTVLLALSSISIIPEADKVLGRAQMFQLAQLVPIARFTADPTVLAVRADSPYHSVADLDRGGEEVAGVHPVRLLGQLRHHARADGDAVGIGGREDAAHPVHRRRSRGGGAAGRPGGSALDGALHRDRPGP